MKENAIQANKAIYKTEYDDLKKCWSVHRHHEIHLVCCDASEKDGGTKNESPSQPHEEGRGW